MKSKINYKVENGKEESKMKSRPLIFWIEKASDDERDLFGILLSLQLDITFALFFLFFFLVWGELHSLQTR